MDQYNIYSNYTKYNHLDINSYKHLNLDWFNLQAHYIKSLNRDEIFTLLGYTELSYPIVNSWCNKCSPDTQSNVIENNDWWSLLKKVIKHIMDKDYFPFFYQFLLLSDGLRPSHSVRSQHFDFSSHQHELIQTIFEHDLDSKKYDHFIQIKHKMTGEKWKIFWNTVISEYVDNLDQIIKRAPKTTSYITVWRGSQTPYWNNSDTVVESFTSTSLDIDTAIEFTTSDKKCCLARIIIPPGIRCLFLGMLSIYSEAEILIGRNSIFKVDPIWMKDKNTISLPYKIRSKRSLESDSRASSFSDIDYELCSNLDQIESTILNFKGYI
jgi:hypothetical protein